VIVRFTISLLPTTGNWADLVEDAILMKNLTRLFFRIISSLIPLIAAILMKLFYERE